MDVRSIDDFQSERKLVTGDVRNRGRRETDKGNCDPTYGFTSFSVKRRRDSATYMLQSTFMANQYAISIAIEIAGAPSMLSLSIEFELDRVSPNPAYSPQAQYHFRDSNA